MKKMLIFVSIFFALVFGWYGVKKVMFMWFFSHYQPPPVTITATHAVSRPWVSYISSIGSFTSINGVDVSAEVSGIVNEILFTSGQMIKKGEPIILLRSDMEKANLKSNQARLELAKMNYERELTLFKKKASSKAQLDMRHAEMLEAEGAMDANIAHIKQKTIIAPFDGRLGIRQVNLGQFVSPNTPLVTLQSVNPLFFMFSVPEQYLSDLALDQSVDITVNLTNEDKVVHGKITAINAKVDPSTRNILVQATIPNDDRLLYPGMYGSIKVWLPTHTKTVLVPQTAISYSLSGDYVFLIKDESQKLSNKKSNASAKAKGDATTHLRAYRQYVKVGERRDNLVTVLDGLHDGDHVVTSGQLKLQNGTSILIDDTISM